jgi:MFS family permease
MPTAMQWCSTMSESHYPAPRTAWGMVGLLTLAYLLSYIDRAVLGLLVQPIKADIALSDEQIGWLLGPAFAIFYATMGLPLGWLVDRKSRTRLIAAGVALWSLATAASGLARTFPQLFMARMTVGVGEAVLSPAAFSIIADSFPEERRARPIAAYSMAITLGSGLASLIGASVLTWARGAERIVLPLVGTVSPWQATFFAVGLPGLLVALAFLLVREPPRQSSFAAGAATRNGLKDAFAQIGSRWRDYLLIVAVVGAMVITAYSQGFLPAAFERRWGWKPEFFAMLNGASALILGPAVYLSAGALCERRLIAGDSLAPHRIMTFGLALAMLMPSPWLAFALLCLTAIGIGAISAVGVTALLQITPGAVRGQVVALYYMAISLAGLLLGPTTVGTLSTRLFGEDQLHLAVAAVPVFYGLIPLTFAVWRLRRG